MFKLGSVLYKGSLSSLPFSIVRPDMAIAHDQHSREEVEKDDIECESLKRVS